MKPTPPPGQTVRKRSVARTIGRVAAWFFGVPVFLMLALYVALLIHPIPLPFISSQVRNLVVASMPANTELELGDMALALEGYAWPVIQFSPVTYKDTASGAKVQMEAFEVGFSPIRAFIGQPGATVTIVGPHIQINQDIFGPRLSEFDIVPDPDGGPATVRVKEGSTAFPDAGFKSSGINVVGETTETTHVRSDNDWLVFNLEAAQLGIASVIEQAEMGRFSRLIIKHATVNMNDAVYGSLRTFTDISLDIAPTPNGKAVEGNFSANFGGTVMRGIFERLIDEKGDARLKISLNNFDLAAFAPLINDTASAGGIVGPGAVSLDLTFNAQSGKILSGTFHMDMTGTDLRLDTDYYPIASNIIEVDWKPETGTFTMAESALTIGDTAVKLSGVFVLGLDDLYGPTVAISMSGKEFTVKDGSASPVTVFDTVSFKGWSAPLYGAVGIDQVIVTKGKDARLESRGRIDMLRKGIGVDLAVAGKGFTADDLKRMWPPLAAPDARDWFVKNVLDGKIDSATMKFAFPVGTLALNGDDKPIPQNGIFIEMSADNVRINAIDGMAPIDIVGKTRLQMHDAEFTVAGDGGVIKTDSGNISVANAALVMTSDTPGESIVEVSGDLSGGIPAVVAIAKQFQPDAIKSDSLPIDVNALAGNLGVRLVSTSVLDSKGAVKRTDYSVNGNVQDFGSTAPLQNHKIGNGQLSFMATQAGYKIAGTAQIDGMNADVTIEGDLNKGSQPPTMTLSSVVDIADLAKMGFDASAFGSGKVGFNARLGGDGSIDMAVDLKSAELTIKDLGITKKAGVAGSLKATIKQTGDVSDISGIDLAFGNVKLKGSLEFDAKKGLKSAEFSNFALSDGDAAQLSMTPIKDGYAVRIRGDQLDLKPLLSRFFSLDQGSGGPQATSVTQTIALDVELKRALGMYKTNAYNLSLDLALKGSDVRKASMQAQIGNGGQVSVATNPTDSGRTMTVVFNDLGSVLRFVGVYAQLQGGEGSFTLAQNTTTKVDNGTVSLKNFAIVDEKNVAALMQGHPEARRAGGSADLAFRSAKADFVRRKDRIEIVEAVVTGDSIGGSGKGFIYTDKKQYDLVGTFIPIFGINNAFGKLFGGGNTGGMFGITFAVRGPLDKPDFKINPMSALAPGAFRSLFEFRAKEQPRVDE